jgi:arylsulfatase A-like enzyme
MKREVKLSAILSLSAFTALGGGDFSKKNTPKPNILYIMADDHTSQAWGIYGGLLKNYVINKNISRLADRGCVLNNCLCSNSICVPSRGTILTGQYSHVNGITTLGGGLNSDAENIAKVLQRGGYQTSVIGKWHLKNEPSGFDNYCVLPGQGRYWNPLMISKGDWADKEQGGKVHTGYSTDIIADMTIDWITNRDKTKPFVAMCHFKATHEPFDYPVRYNDLLKDTVLPVPDSFYDFGAETTGRTFDGQSLDELKIRYLNASKAPANSLGYKRYPGLPFSVDGLNNDEARMKTYQKFIKDYIRCGAAIDDNIGKLLDYLDKTGLAENTIIIYTSDQGYFLGEHGWFDKRMIFEESIRMPFVISYPKEIPAGTRNSDIIENVDFSALFADYAGLDYPKTMQGRSFRENLKGHTPADWRKYGYYRYWEHEADRPGHFGIRGNRYVLAFYYGNGFEKKAAAKTENKGTKNYWEFYDLNEDPHELHNAFEDPKYTEIIKAMKAEILNQRQVVGDNDKNNPEILEIIARHWND